MMGSTDQALIYREVSLCSVKDIGIWVRYILKPVMQKVPGFDRSQKFSEKKKTRQQGGSCNQCVSKMPKSYSPTCHHPTKS